jgi:hypothetical protein
MDHIGQIIAKWAENLCRAHEQLDATAEMAFVADFHRVLSRLSVMLNFFNSSLMKGTNKLECLSFVSLSSPA